MRLLRIKIGEEVIALLTATSPLFLAIESICLVLCKGPSVVTLLRKHPASELLHGDRGMQEGDGGMQEGRRGLTEGVPWLALLKL